MHPGRRMVLLVLCLAAPAVLTACSGGGTAPAPAGVAVADPAVVGPGEPWIAFQESAAQGVRVTLVRPDGTGAHALAPDRPAGNQTNPDWSPDGTRLVFAAGDGPTDDLWLAGADGTDVARFLDCVAPCVTLDDPAWSPDGRSVLYARTAEADGVGRATLEVAPVAGGAPRVLLVARPDEFFAGPRWAPGGDAIVVERVRRAGPAVDDEVTGVRLVVVDVTGPRPRARPLTPAGEVAVLADWSPDGRSIVYSRGDPGDLVSVRPDGTGAVALTDLGGVGGFATEPSFTPDGVAIVFVAQVDAAGEGGMALVGPAGGDVRPATGATYRAGAHPRWRPVS